MKWAVPAALVALFLAPPALGQRKKPTELERELKNAATRDYAAAARPFLAPYARAAGDQRTAYLVDNNWHVSDAPAMTTLLNDMAAVLLRGWTGPRPDIRIVVQADGTPGAYADGPALVKISFGMIEKLGSADLVAAAIAHEIAHVLLGHAEQRKRTETILRAGIGLASSGAVYASLGQASSPKAPNAAPRAKAAPAHVTLTSDVADRMITGYLADVIASDVLIPVAKGRQEFEADRLAADLLVISPFPADTQAAALTTVADAEIAAAQRLGRLSDVLTGMTAYKLLSKAAGGNDLAQGVAVLGAGGAGVALKCGIDWLGRIASGEADADERRKKFREYGRVYGPDGYPLADERNAELLAFRSRFDAIRAQPAWKALVRAASQAADARRALEYPATRDAAKGCGKSEIMVEPGPLPTASSIVGHPQVPSTYLVRGLVAIRANQYSVALAALEAGANHPAFPVVGYQQLAQLHIHARDTRGLRAAIDRGRVRAGRDRALLPHMVALAALEGKAADAEKLAARCLSEGGADTYMLCQGYIGYNAACSPRTDEGRLAFAGASMQRRIADLAEIQRAVGGEGQSVDCDARGRPAAAAGAR